MSQELTGPTLTRYVGQRVVAGDVVVEVVQVSGGRVRLKILAPQGTPINREEILPLKALAKQSG